MNDTRLRWISETAPELTTDLAWFEHQPERALDAAQLSSALQTSADATAALIQRCAQKNVGVNGYPGSLASFLGYFISHESYHWGEISSILTQAGVPMSDDAKFGIWRGWWGREVKE